MWDDLVTDVFNIKANKGDNRSIHWQQLTLVELLNHVKVSKLISAEQNPPNDYTVNISRNQQAGT